MHNSDPRIPEDEVGRSQDQGQPGLHDRNLSGVEGREH